MMPAFLEITMLPVPLQRGQWIFSAISVLLLLGYLIRPREPLRSDEAALIRLAPFRFVGFPVFTSALPRLSPVYLSVPRRSFPRPCPLGAAQRHQDGPREPSFFHAGGTLGGGLYRLFRLRPTLGALLVLLAYLLHLYYTLCGRACKGGKCKISVKYMGLGKLERRIAGGPASYTGPPIRLRAAGRPRGRRQRRVTRRAHSGAWPCACSRACCLPRRTASASSGREPSGSRKG